jgi:hypothetical protein
MLLSIAVKCLKEGRDASASLFFFRPLSSRLDECENISREIRIIWKVRIQVGNRSKNKVAKVKVAKIKRRAL